MKEVPFKANDIRGVYPDEVNDELFYRIGLVLPKVLKARRIAIGRDVRLSSNALFSMLAEGINDAGCDVIDLGLCDTPHTYFISGKYNVASCMITASHNTKEFNGLKIVLPGSIPINDIQVEALLRELEKQPREKNGAREGDVLHFNKKNEYANFILSKIGKNELSKMKIVVDCSNGMAYPIMKEVLSRTPAEIMYINKNPDGEFPNHVPNPAVLSNLKQLQRAVRKEHADLGIMFDGDCDRVAFVDEMGEIIDSSIMASIFSHYMLESNPDANVVMTVTHSRILPETIKLYGGNAIEAKVGHRFIKEAMRRGKAIFGAEPSGHFYFKSNYYADSGPIAAMAFYELLSKIKTRPSLLRKTFEKYVSLGEMNYKVSSRAAAFRKIKSMLKSKKPAYESSLDGYAASIIDSEGQRTYITVRISNTESLIRITIESTSRAAALKMKKEVEKLLK